ncbi:MAG: MlaD family protein [Bacteroidota bacterium]
MVKVKDSIKLGLFVLVGLGLLVVIIYFIGREQSLFGNYFKIYSNFENVKGLKVGNNVRFSGINVGTVNDIIILNDSTVQVEMLVRENVRKFIRENSKASIETEGLMGSRTVSIIPGNMETEIIKDEDRIASLEPVEMDDILRDVKESSTNVARISENLVGITGKINRGEGIFGKIFGDTTMLMNLDNAGENVFRITEDIRKMSSTIENEKGVLGKLLNDTSLGSQLEQSGKNLAAISEDFSTITKKINQGEGIFGKLFTDTALSANLKIISQNLQKTSTNTRNTTENLDKITTKITSGEGLINKLLIDSAFADSFAIAIQNISSGAQNVSELTETLDRSWIFRIFSKNKDKKKKEKQNK